MRYLDNNHPNPRRSQALGLTTLPRRVGQRLSSVAEVACWASLIHEHTMPADTSYRPTKRHLVWRTGEPTLCGLSLADQRGTYAPDAPECDICHQEADAHHANLMGGFADQELGSVRIATIIMGAFGFALCCVLLAYGAIMAHNVTPPASAYSHALQSNLVSCREVATDCHVEVDSDGTQSVYGNVVSTTP